MRFILIVLSLSLSSGQTIAKEIKPIKLSKAQVQQVKTTVIRDFLDPDTAKFRNLHAVEITKSNGKVISRVCGEVNGKNAYGGYTGYSMFGGVLQGGRFKRRDFFMPCK